MADPGKEGIRKIRHKIKPPEKPEPLWKRLKAEAEARRLQEEFWERDKKVVRDANFQKALIAREQQVDAIRAEKERQAENAQERLDNLKKARRKLKRLRDL